MYGCTQVASDQWFQVTVHDHTYKQSVATRKLAYRKTFLGTFNHLRRVSYNHIKSPPDCFHLKIKQVAVAMYNGDVTGIFNMLTTPPND